MAVLSSRRPELADHCAPSQGDGRLATRVVVLRSNAGDGVVCETPLHHSRAPRQAETEPLSRGGRCPDGHLQGGRVASDGKRTLESQKRVLDRFRRWRQYNDAKTGAAGDHVRRAAGFHVVG